MGQAKSDILIEVLYMAKLMSLRFCSSGVCGIQDEEWCDLLCHYGMWVQGFLAVGYFVSKLVTGLSPDPPQPQELAMRLR